MKIRFDSYDDDQPSDKISYFSNLNIIVESVFRIENEYYPQSHLKTLVFITLNALQKTMSIKLIV